MTRNNKNRHNSNGRNQGKQSKKPNQSSSNQVPTKAIFEMAVSSPRADKIEESSTDHDRREIKEKIYTYKDCEHKENLLIFERQLLQLGTRYELFE